MVRDLYHRVHLDKKLPDGSFFTLQVFVISQYLQIGQFKSHGHTNNKIVYNK